jgi:putative oxidoreductase
MNSSDTPSSCSGARLYNAIPRFFDYGQSPLLLLIRLYIGYQCCISGWGHLHNVEQMVQNFTDWHIPMPRLNVYISGITECVGGALFLVGFLSRLVSLVLAGNFTVAILAVSLSDPVFRPMILHFWNNPDVIIKDTAFPFLAASILVLFFGPGVVSIDYLIRRFILKSDSRPGFPVAPPPAQS